MHPRLLISIFAAIGACHPLPRKPALSFDTEQSFPIELPLKFSKNSYLATGFLTQKAMGAKNAVLTVNPY